MTAELQNGLTQFSETLAARTGAAERFVASLRVKGSRPLSATVMRPGVAISSEQVFPKAGEAELQWCDGRKVAARVAGRDPATNILALRFEEGTEPLPPAAGEPRLGALALLLAADRGGGPVVRLTILRALGPAWHSLLGGHIDRRIALDLTLSGGEEGGPVFDVAGGFLGMSTAGPRGRALVIPAATIERVLAPLLAAGRVERGWLGAAVHPVALPETIAGEVAQDRGLMVLRLKPEGPAARAGVLAGDILIRVGEVPALHPGDLARLLGPESVGQMLPLHLLRAGAPLSLTAIVTARPAP
jgi:S1-C subfamily serine protease